MSAIRKMGFVVLSALFGLFIGGCQSGPVGVMTFNIHQGQGSDGRLDLDRIADVISQSQADIVGLNEVDNRFGSRSANEDQARYLAGKLGMNYVYGPTLSTGSGDSIGYYGNALLSRYEISDVKIHMLPNEKGQEQRNCIQARLDVDGSPVTVLVTHLNHKGEPLRQRQASRLLEIADSVESGPVILMGDFNSQAAEDAGSQPHGTIAKITEKLADSFAIAGKGDKYTYSNDDSTESGRIDFIFVSSDLKSSVRSAMVLKAGQAEKASDHWPVVTELVVK